MDVKMRDDATHQPVLFEAIRHTKGPILELGAGESSTNQIHDLAEGRKILTVDDNQEWLNNYKHLETSYHRFMMLTEDIFSLIGRTWCVVLVDLTTWEQRMWVIKELRFYVDYMVIHDAQDKDLGKLFDFWREYRVTDFPMPTTLLASNLFKLDNIFVEGATIVNHG